ncbi:radial spoke head 10 homolog B-like [Haliotis rufescens]|uniref:radial spoke head 10 homolog B-like n=1 Tax=Haliotis rufescens TaxID=6454 RepID=UPI001EB02EAF|nr:radial spoke head 10 homolog B-like [Haliotis rufescens]
MATKAAKGAKQTKETDKKGNKKNDELPLVEEKKEDSPVEGEFNDTPETVETETVEDLPPPKEPTPEPVYDEPTLSELIIECFEGEKARGLYEGEGKASFAGGHCYIGQFSEGLMHGKGMYVWADGVVYEGDFCKNQVTGKGSYKWPDESTYEGEVLNGKRHGAGTFRCPDNAMSYSGDWCGGKRHGKGRMDYDPNGRSYFEGDWVYNIRHGWGTRQYPSGNVYQGMWFNNVRHGEGTMKWLDRNQIYTGQWENGIQHGMGQHNWLLQRVQGSQYPLRNMYDGEFVNGLRHGFGTFYYANGARYEGYWKNNMKHGKGKFTFKNGRIYEGMFEKDHIVEYPDFNVDGATTPDITSIRTRTPLPSDNVSMHSNESRNTISPSFQLEINHLLAEFTDIDREEELSQVMYVTMRHVTSLRKVYNYYSCLGYEESPDNTFIMNKMQFWRFLKDCQLDHEDATLMDMDRVIGLGYNKPSYSLHNPYERILQREFINYLIILAFHLFHEQHDGSSPVLAWCMSKLIQEKVLRNSCNVKGNIYYETRRSVNALVHMDQAYEVYQSVCKHRVAKPKEPALKMRQFLFMTQDLKLINSDLTPQAILEVLASDDPKVADGEGCYNLELEMTFLEFFEALVGCAQVYVTEQVVKDPSTPRPSTVMTHDQSMYSVPASPSRLTSQAGMDDSGDTVAQATPHHTPHGGSNTPAASPSRAQSSGAGTAKTGGEGSSKVIDPQQSSSVNLGLTSDRGHQGTSQSHHDSAKGDVTPLADQQKSASFISNHTNGTEENAALVQSSVSMAAHTEPSAEHPEGVGEDHADGAAEDHEVEVEVELDEATRLFNFWTHQIHIFFVRKFFPAAEKLADLKRLVEKRQLDESKMRLMTINASRIQQCDPEKSQA